MHRYAFIFASVCVRNKIRHVKFCIQMYFYINFFFPSREATNVFGYVHSKEKIQRGLKAGVTFRRTESRFSITRFFLESFHSNQSIYIDPNGGANVHNVLTKNSD